MANTPGTRFAVASGTKALTALTVVSLVVEWRLGLATPARSVLGGDLPLIGGDVTVEHLLAHRSGIGDYVDEDAGIDVTDYLLPVPVHELATTAAYLPVLDGHPAKFPAGQRFAYCNSGYVVLALLAERVARRPFHELVDQRPHAGHVSSHAAVVPRGLSKADPHSLRAAELLREQDYRPLALFGYSVGFARLPRDSGTQRTRCPTAVPHRPEPHRPGRGTERGVGP